MNSFIFEDNKWKWIKHEYYLKLIIWGKKDTYEDIISGNFLQCLSPFLFICIESLSQTLVLIYASINLNLFHINKKMFYREQIP